MSDQYPAMPPGQPSAAGGPMPTPVATAQKLMFLRAFLGLVSVILLFILRDDFRRAIRKRNPDYDASKLDNVVNVAIIVGVVISIVFLVLYLLLALQVGQGKRWAWIVTLILAGLGVLSAISSLVQTAPGLSKTISAVAGVVDLAIFVLLIQRRSNQFFAKL